MSNIAYEVADEVQKNLDEINRRYAAGMSRKRNLFIATALIALVGTIVFLAVILGLGL